MKKWLSVFTFFAILLGLASTAVAQTNLEMANRLIAQIEKIGEITDPKLQLDAIKEFMWSVQGLTPSEKKEVVETLRKWGWNVGGNNWWVIMEAPYKNQPGAHVGAYFTHDPPKDIKILETKGELKK